MEGLCDAEAGACLCQLSTGHGSAHQCACGAAWTGSLGSDFAVIAWPGSNLDYRPPPMIDSCD